MQSSYKTVTSEFVQPKKSILSFRNNKFYFSFKKLIHCIVSFVLDSRLNVTPATMQIFKCRKTKKVDYTSHVALVVCI